MDEPASSDEKVLFVVAAALVDADGKVLLQKRPRGKSMAGLWEFPGGKVEAGERPEAALCRELEEELGIRVDPATMTPLTFARAEVGAKHLVLLLYVCKTWQGTPEALHAESIMWVRPEEMDGLAMPPADVPLVETLKRQI